MGRPHRLEPRKPRLHPGEYFEPKRRHPGRVPNPVTTRGGQTYAGTLASENEQQLVLRVVGLPPVTVAKSEIQSRETIPTSMMPEGLMATMKDGEVIDLITYLRTTKQVGKK